MRLLHIGCYGIPKIALPGVLPPLDAPAPETQWRDTLCSWMPRIKAAGFDCVASEVRTPAMVDAWLGAVKNAAEHAGLRFGTSWQLHDEASLAYPEWCAAPNYGKDTAHPLVRTTMLGLAECDIGFDSGSRVIDRLTQTFGGPFLLNMEGFFGACKDFPPAWGAIIGKKLGQWLESMANDGYSIYWYHPDYDQASSSGFAKKAWEACYGVTAKNERGPRYCRTANVPVLYDATFNNHAAAHRYGITTAQWLAMDDSRDRILSVGFSVLDRVLRDMGV